MGKASDSTTAEQAECLLKDSITEADIGNSRLSPTIRENLLVEDEEFRALVGPWYLFLLTCCVGGFQVVWTVILSNGAPFLVSLGLSKSRTTLVWIAAPLCGAVAQPIIGSFGDRSQSRFGRRRPFILGGSIGIAISVLSLAWTPEFVHASINGVSGDSESDVVQNIAILLAVFWIYALNLSIQCVQSGSRALIIEACPPHQQDQASAWASITAGGWNIFGYLCGFSALPKMFSTDFTQFQCLSIIASVSMISTALVTCLCIRETPISLQKRSVKDSRSGIVTILEDLRRTYQHMPPNIRRTCHIQFWAWMGRFPFLYYSTTYVAEFYRETTIESNSGVKHVLPPPPPLTQTAIRHGTFANFLFATVAFAASIALPFLISLSKRNRPHTHKQKQVSRFNIAQAWSMSHFFWALVMFSTFFIDNPLSATVLVASLGVSWAVSQWAPYAIIGKELAASQLLREQIARYGDNEQEHRTTSSSVEDVQAAAVMGIHNAAISAPQVAAALVCSFVFSVVKAMGWNDGTAWVMRVGGLAALGAGWLSLGSEL